MNSDPLTGHFPIETHFSMRKKKKKKKKKRRRRHKHIWFHQYPNTTLMFEILNMQGQLNYLCNIPKKNSIYNWAIDGWKIIFFLEEGGKL